MTICHVFLTNSYTEGKSYQENILSKYHVMLGHRVVMLAAAYTMRGGKYRRLPAEHYLNADGVEVFRLTPRRFLFPDRRFNRFPELRAKLEAISPDILFVHNPQFLDAGVVAAYVKRHPNCRLFVDSHSDFSNSATNWISKTVLHRLLWKHTARKLLPCTEMFYGVLPARVDFLVDIYGLPREKCELLVMGAEDDLVEKARASHARERIRAQYGIAGDDFLIITGGVIDRWKTQTLLLMEAVRNIRDERLRLIVFGSFIPELREQAERLIDGDRIRFIGWLRPEQTYDYVEAADLAVFPGRHSVFWEQVAGQGVPMLVKDWPGTHHVDIGGNVRFLKEDSEEEIRGEIERLLSHPEEYEAMREAARENGMRVFSYRDIAERSIRPR